jgi:hypothetical protein
MFIETSKVLLASGLRDLILFKLSRNNDTDRVFWECYQNGREQGFTVSVIGILTKSKSITISEYRNSDSIIVYKDNTAMQGLDEKSYNNCTSFKPDDFSGIIDFCYKYLISKE